MFFKDFTNFISKDFTFTYANIIYVNKLREVKSWPEKMFLSLAIKREKKIRSQLMRLQQK